jgi:hypothetical protein
MNQVMYIPGVINKLVLMLSQAFSQLDFESTLYQSAPAILLELLLLFGSFTKRPVLYWPFLIYQVARLN